MTSAPIIDVEQLLAPINVEQPTGTELDASDLNGSFQKIKDPLDEARKLIKEQQDKELSGGIDSFGQAWRVIPTPDWTTVIERAQTTLQQESKDFRVAAWLSEALLREYHVVGLRDGLQLCLGLCQRYWDAIHPAASEEDGHGVTMGAFAGLVADSTYIALLNTPIVRGTKPGERSERVYTALDYIRAKDTEGIANPSERERRLELGYVGMSEFRAIADLTAKDFFSDTLEAANSCLASCEELGEFFHVNCQDDEYGEPTSPGLAGIRQQLETLRRIIIELSGTEPTAMASNEDEVETDRARGSAANTKSQEMTRESAFQTIERVAQFFERTEPHSPVYFALRQVVRWGRMPFPDLLVELIADDSVMNSLRKQIGLPPEKYNE